MKKNLALILALVMLLSTVFAVVPMAAATEATPPAAASEYEPKISYANVNYSDKLYVMFAVPAPAADLGEGVEVKLLAWASKDKAEAYSFKDQNVIKLTAETEKATIDGAQYLVFKYDALTAADMTNIIAARPVVLYNWEETVEVTIPEEKNEAGEVTKPAETKTEIVSHTDVVAYGDIVEYSVLEYVATANGAFGATALADDVLEMLNSMITFGGLAQKYSGKEYDFLASDELAKIWYIPVVRGVAGEKVFGGFFKKGAELATVSAPHVEGYAFTSFIDAEGNALYDIDGLATNGDQMPLIGEDALPLDENGDLVIKANYDLHYFYRPDANKATDASTNLYEDKTGNKWTSDKGGLGINLGSDTSVNKYGALDVVNDPYQAGNKVYRIVGNLKHNMGPGNTTNDWKVSLKPSATPGFNDTFAPVVTVDIVVARGATGEMLKTGKIKLRSGSNGETAVGYFTNDGTFMFYTDGGSATALPTKVAETGYSRFVFVVDFTQEAIFAFAAENADDELVYQGISTHPEFSHKGKHFSENPWIDWAMTLDRLEWWGEATEGFTEAEMKGGVLADLNGDGVGETPMIDEQGNLNKAATAWCYENLKPTMLVKEYCAYAGSPVDVPVHVHEFVRGKCVECGKKDPNYVPEIDAATAQAMYRQYRALLIKDWDSYIGYAGQPVHTTYNIDANGATVPSKNSQLLINNFTDDKLPNYYKEGYEGLTLTLGGLGMNAAKVVNTDPLQYAGIDVIDDPYYTGEGTNKVYSFNGGVVKDNESLGAYIFHGANVSAAVAGFGPYKGSTGTLLAKDEVKTLFATTPVLTYDMTVGGNGYDRMLETDTIRFRGNSDTFVHLFKIAADGSILICKPNADYTDAEFVDTGVDVKKNGWTRIVAEVDCAKKTFKLYVADEGAELVCVATVTDNLWVTKSGISHGAATAATAYKDAENWLTLASKLDRSEFVAAAGNANKFTDAEKKTADSFKPEI